jgi:hypothetical protein
VLSVRADAPAIGARSIEDPYTPPASNRNAAIHADWRLIKAQVSKRAIALVSELIRELAIEPNREQLQAPRNDSSTTQQQQKKPRE